VKKPFSVEQIVGIPKKLSVFFVQPFDLADLARFHCSVLLVPAIEDLLADANLDPFPAAKKLVAEAT